MYSHVSSNDQTENLDFVNSASWLLWSTIAPLWGTYSAYGKDGSTPWIEIQTDAGPIRLNGVDWAYHKGAAPTDNATTRFLQVSATAYISVSRDDSVDSVFSHTHQTSFDNVYGNGTRPALDGILWQHPINIISQVSKQRVDGTRFGDVITLNNQGSEAYSNNGKDTVHGGLGDDKIAGGNGGDTLFGSGGQDHIDGGNGRDTIYGGDDDDEIHGDAGNDVAYGGDGQDTIFGETGKDKLYGGEDDDRVFGSADRDKIYGGGGQDKIYGDDGNDKLFGDADNDEVYGGRGRDKIIGGLGQDKLYGDAGPDTIFGEDDNDRLYGSGGDDRLYGGIGQDFINGDNGKDSLFGGADNDDLNGLAGKDKLVGGVGQDDLDGGSGKDRLKGGADNDRLDGGSESDVLSGGGGSNQFVFSTGLSAKNIDRITDFKVGFDSLELSHKVFGALPVGALPESEFHKGAKAQTSDQHVIYDAKQGLLVYDQNGSAKGGDQVFARLDKNLDLGHSDFLVI
ncbi:MAG: hypothetical protein KDJ86_15650 [Bauldia sp.]|uniref:calcium-binding protein n=1 Tax=Bauldia sp. TaxID=2575872 RepID=UPI001D1C0665|nr:calcium-binding protein [Bauldia sp.]MCB1497224.1 hypothetical protein [Bauldia sp.]